MNNSGHYKKILLVVSVFILTLWGGYELFFYLDKKSEEQEVVRHKHITRFTEEETALLQEGDFILRRGFGFFSDMISRRLNDSDIVDVTHAGILVKNQDKWYVIHSLSSDVTPIDGMQIQSLKKFLRYSHPRKIMVTRVKNLSENQPAKIAQRARYYLKKAVPFDHQGDYEDSTKMYCTELIWRILEKDLKLIDLPRDTKERDRIFFTMNGMYDTTYFDVIINQYDHQLLP